MEKLLFFFFLLTATTAAAAENKTLQIASDSRSLILLENFEFSRSGHITINVSSFNASSEPSPDSLGFLLLSHESLFNVIMEIQQNPSSCALDSRFIHRRFYFRPLSPHKITVPVSDSQERQYSLFFANCNPKSSISMTINTEKFNLPFAQTQLPALYFLFSIAYFGFLGFWLQLCRNTSGSLHTLHFTIAGLLFIKSFDLLCQAMDKQYFKLRAVLLFTGILFMGNVWSFFKDFFQEKQAKVIMIVIPLQVLIYNGSIVLNQTAPFIIDWLMWNQVFFFVEIVCCYAIISRILHSMRSLSERSKTDYKAALNLAKLTLLWQFYTILFAFMYFNRIGVLALKINFSYKYQWMSNAEEETSSLAFYLVLCYIFKPEEEEKDQELADIYEEF